MKTILLSVCGLLAIFQVGSCHPPQLVNAIQSAGDQCWSGRQINMDVLIEQLGKRVVAEDDKQAREFLECFSKVLKIHDEAGTVDYERLSLVVQEMLKVGMDTTEVDTKAQKIANNAIEHCKKSTKDENASMMVLKMRNCLINFLDKDN